MIEWISGWPPAVWLQQSAVAYPLVNAAHILGIGLLLGAILPLDLRLMGFFRRVPLEVLGPFLRRSAATGLALAMATGLWLFSVNPAEYLSNPAFLWKLGLLALALGNVACQHWRRGDLALPDATTRVLAGVSLCLWLSVLVAGRWIGFL